jgi:hypothetical protein
MQHVIDARHGMPYKVRGLLHKHNATMLCAWVLGGC